MKLYKTLRCVSLAMFVVAVVFVLYAISNPQLGRAIYIGNFRFSHDEWLACYMLYAVVMVGLFAASFFVKKKEG